MNGPGAATTTVEEWARPNGLILWGHFWADGWPFTSAQGPARKDVFLPQARSTSDAK